LITVLTALVVVAGVATFVASRSHKAAPPDTRPLAFPDTIAGMYHATDPDAAAWGVQMEPILQKMFGSNASVSAMYGGFPRIYLLAGRGSMDHAKAGDVRLASHTHRNFGEVTCAYLTYKGQELTSVDVCWYSSAEFSASLTFVDQHGDSALHARALEAALPTIRN